ncbi:hypothetical protein [Rhodococcoides corynebacterioides]|uniref:hypothetical protein n=1 Tax=Rhodococcoides corynebacterioides TaxID=53972 RepID=UPI0008299853|nr:hypothetical protein [Rhodococcus corynebacterioides]
MSGPLDDYMSGPLDAILDEGASGLRFFDRVLPWRDDAGGTGPSYLDLCARYDGQRGLDTDVLRADAARCRDVATTLRAELAVRTEAATELSTAWTGAAATAAGDVLAAQSARATLDLDHLDLAASTLDRAAEGLRAIVQDKAVAAADHHRSDVGGRDLDDAQATVVGATQDPSTWSVDTVSRLTALVPELRAAVAGGAVALWERPDVVDAVIRACRDWVDGVFIPAVEEATTSFDDLCSDSHAAVERIFDVVDSALGDLCTDPYPTASDPVPPPTPPAAPAPTAPAAAPSCANSPGTGSPSAPPVATPDVPGPAAPTAPAVPTVPAVSAVPVPDAPVTVVPDLRVTDVVRAAVVEAVTAVLSGADGAVIESAGARDPVQSGIDSGIEARCESSEAGLASEPSANTTSPVDATPAPEVGRVEVKWAGGEVGLVLRADGSIDLEAGPASGSGSAPTGTVPSSPAEPETPGGSVPSVDPAPPVDPAPSADPAPAVDPAPSADPAPAVDPPPADCVPDVPVAAVAPSAPAEPGSLPALEPTPAAGPRPALAEAGPL